MKSLYAKRDKHERNISWKAKRKETEEGEARLAVSRATERPREIKIKLNHYGILKLGFNLCFELLGQNLQTFLSAWNSFLKQFPA